jgi:phosphopantetheinyl transferase
MNGERLTRAAGAVQAPRPGELLLVTHVAQVADLADWQALLSDAERKRIARFRLQCERDTLTAAHGFKRLLLARLTLSAPEALAFDVAPGGKPELAGSSLRFNLSHSGGRVALALAHGHEVGADLESPRWLDAQSLARRVLHPLERLPPAPDDQQVLLQHWVAKEAVTKAWGMGLRQPFPALLGQAGGAGWRHYPAGERQAWVQCGLDEHGYWAAAMAGTRPKKFRRVVFTTTPP